MNLSNILEHVKAMEADMGGTELMQPLTEVLNTAFEREDSRRFVYVITDGAVSNTQELLNLVKTNENIKKKRILMSTIGIGSGASTELVVGLAKEGHGKFDILIDEHKITSTVIRQISL